MATEKYKLTSISLTEQEKSYNWYRNQVRNLGDFSRSKLFQQTNKLVSTPIPGELYLFMYDPKHKDKLPYYDILPLVFPFRKMPDGFLGVNLHYLPYMIRFKLLNDLDDLVQNRNIPERTRIRLSWDILNNSSRYLPATACVKHYLTNQMKSRFLRIDYKDWKMAAMMPLENFKKKSKEKAWQNTKKGY
jgi:hypothetical protein